jgi:hypothetical protein
MKKAYPWFFVFISMVASLLAMLYVYNNYSFSINLANKNIQKIVINKKKDNIQWLIPTKISSLELLDDNYFIDEMIEIDEDDFSYYKIGYFISGKYKNAELILLKQNFWFNGFYRFIKTTDNKIILLSKHSETKDIPEFLHFDSKKYTIDDSYEIPDLNFPETLKGPNRESLTLIEGEAMFFDDTKIKQVFNSSKLGNVYTTKQTNIKDLSGFQSNDFYIQAIDNTVITYSLKLDIFSKDCDKKECIIDITWKNGEKNTAAYNRYFFNNDLLNLGTYVLDASDKNILIEAGKTKSGKIIYELAMDDLLLQNAYENTYMVYNAEIGKMTYQEYYKQHPIIVWEDSFGRLLILENDEFIKPGGGMGI